MKIEAKTPIWVVTDPTPVSTFPDICFETTLEGFRLQFADGLSMDAHHAIFTAREEAHEEAGNRRLVWKVARQIRIERRLSEGDVMRVTLHDQDGRVLFEGEVGQARALVFAVPSSPESPSDQHSRCHKELSIPWLRRLAPRRLILSSAESTLLP